MSSTLPPIEDMRLMLPVGHASYLKAGEFSPDGKYALTVGEVVNIWDVSSGKLIRSIDGHFHYVTSAHFSPDGKYIATASWDKTAKIWEVSTGKMVHTLVGHREMVFSASYSPACPDDPRGGKYLATVSWDKTVKIWLTEIGKILHTRAHKSDVSSENYCFSPNGRLLITYSCFPVARLRAWDVSSGKLLFIIKGSDYSFYNVQFSKPNDEDPIGGKYIFSFSQGLIYIFDSIDGQLIRTLRCDDSSFSEGQLTPDGKNFVCWQNQFVKTIQFRNIESGQLMQSFNSHHPKICSIEFSPACAVDPVGGKKMITTCPDNSVRIYETSSGLLLHTLESHSAAIVSSQFSKDNERILTTSSDLTAKIWNANSGQLLHTLSGSAQSVTSASFAPNLKQIYVYYGDNTLRHWDINTGQIIRTIKNRAVVFPNSNVSPDHSKLVTLTVDDSAKVKIKNATTLEVLCVLEGHTDCVHTAKFSPACEDDPPGGRYVVTASCDSTAKVWDAETGTLLHTLAEHAYCVESAQFNPDGKLILTASKDRTAKIWDTHSGQLLKSFPITGYDITVSSDWTRLLSIHRATISIYDLSTGQELLSWMAVGEKDWVVIHPTGLVDASPGAMEKLYWVEGMTIMESSTLKERYYESGLWEKVMRGEKLKSDK